MRPAGARACGKVSAASRAGQAFTPTPRPSYSPGARAVADLLPGVAKPAFERYGFALVDILQHWDAYAGKELARYTAPEKLKWPRASQTDASSEGATLILRVDGPRIVEVQYRIPQLIERLNAAFGYRAITAIRLLQAPLPRPPQPRAATQPPVKPDEKTFSHVADGRLRAALSLMSAGVRMRKAQPSA